MTEAINLFAEAYNDLMAKPHLASQQPALIERLAAAALRMQKECEKAMQQSADDQCRLAEMDLELRALETENARLSRRVELLQLNEDTANEIGALIYENALKSIRSGETGTEYGTAPETLVLAGIGTDED